MPGNILQWVKANLLIVASCALIIILLPTGWFFSNKWNNSIQQKATEAYNAEKRKLKKASEVEYSLPAVLKGEEGLTDKRAPNAIVTRFYKERIQERKDQVAEVVQRGVEFNQAGHTVPVDGLLPESSSVSELRKQGYKLGQLIAGTQESPSIYARLLRSLNAGDAPDPEFVTSTIEQFKEQQEEQFAATSSDGQVSQEQTTSLAQALIKKRLDIYASQAESIAFYCPLNAIQTESKEPGYSYIPSQAPGYDSINELAVFTWVWDYWVITDVLKGITAANTDPSGVSLAVPNAPVKHVELIRIAEFVPQTPGFEEEEDSSSQTGRGRGGRGGSSTPDPASTLAKSYTNRNTPTPDSPYDIRLIDLTVIVSSKDLPKLFDALGKTNYMTVVDVDISQIDVWDALNLGYYYGPDHVVRAHITIESVWLRSWTAPLMPKSIRTSLGIVLDSDNPSDEFDG